MSPHQQNEHFEQIKVSGERQSKRQSERQKKQKRKPCVFKDSNLLTDAERDELHIEIYRYMTWLAGKIDRIENDKKSPALAANNEENTGAVESGIESTEAAPPSGLPIPDVSSVHQSNLDSAVEVENTKDNKTPTAGINTAALRDLLLKMEESFLCIPNVELDAEKEELVSAATLRNAAVQLKSEGGTESATPSVPSGPIIPLIPFLETTLRDPLAAIVANRESLGLKKRSKRQQRQQSTAPLGGLTKTGRKRKRRFPPTDFETMLERLKDFKQANGHTNVGINNDDQQLAYFVRGIRARKATLNRKGIDFEELAPGKHPHTQTITRERYDVLNSIGFQWTVIAGPKVSWEGRFKDLMEYYYREGKWPSQSMGSLGEWVHKQRTLYNKGDKNYMKNNFPRLDAVGFEWTPRGNTRVTWEEGYELLVAFGRLNGHFDVPDPIKNGEEGQVNNKSSHSGCTNGSKVSM